MKGIIRIESKINDRFYVFHSNIEELNLGLNSLASIVEKHLKNSNDENDYIKIEIT